MYYDKKKYEQLILESPLFSLDRETEYTAFKRESYRMVEYLYCYLLSINEIEYEPYGCEITEVATRCISNFDVSKGVFLHYFNAAWKQEYSHILSKQIEDAKYRGIRVTEEDRRAVRKYIKLSERLGEQVDLNELYKKLSEAMGLPIDRIIELAKLSGITVCGDSYTREEGEEQSLWEQISGGEDIGLDIETEEEMELILTRIEHAFCSLQERQKSIVSDMITARICSFLTESVRGKFSFISEAVMEEWSRDGSVPTQREIAGKDGRNEASVSRTFKDFLKKIKRED